MSYQDFYVQICRAEPMQNDCPPEFAEWVLVSSIQSDSFAMPTLEEFQIALPWIITMLCIAWSFRLLVRFILNR